MRTFILDIIPKIKKYSEKLDKVTALTNKHWVLIDDELKKKIVFIFREKNNQLLISENGRVEKGNWEYLEHNSLLIDRSDGSYLFKHGFIDNHVLALKVDGTDEYALLVNEQKFDESINSLPSVITFLNETYIEQKKNEPVTGPISQSPVSTEGKIQTSRPKELFSPDRYPDLVADVKLIREKLMDYSNDYLAEIVIGFARDHSVKGIWEKENPEVVDMVVNRRVPIGSLELLFKRNKDNSTFRRDLENYLTKELKQ